MSQRMRSARQSIDLLTAKYLKMHLARYIICISHHAPLLYAWTALSAHESCPLEILRKTRGEHSAIFFSIE